MIGLLGIHKASMAQTTNADPAQKDFATQKINIVKYLLKKVQWPSGALPDNSINLCIMGEDEALSKLLAMEGKTYNNHLVKVRKITNIKAKAARSDCQLVYISASEAKNITPIIYLFKKRPVLLLADIENFAEKGGTMNFSKIKDQIALTINMESMESANLKMELKEFDEITVVPSLKEVMETR